MDHSIAKENHLVISALGSDRKGIISDLAKVFSDYQCNIVDSRMTVLGNEFAIIMMVSGSWDAVAKLENALPSITSSMRLKTIIRQTQSRQRLQSMTYSVNVVSLDHPGIVYAVADFFADREIKIVDLETGTYRAPHTDTKMFHINMTLSIPTTTHLASLREEFTVFCDERSLDALLEPVKSF